ncbi:HAD family phosphatase [Bacillaceae bacterium Marseille-Q3522]|nr:HAD family phosphatase [Bacillaceae bacterium Marseille-Q3522]
MKYKLLAIDLDGTLLNTEKVIDPQAIRAIRSFREQGGKVVICSGRSPLSTRWVSEYIGLNEPIIAYNGSVIQTAAGEILTQSLFPNDAVLSLTELCKTEAAYIQLYEGDQLLFSEENDINRHWIENNILSLAASGKLTDRCEAYRSMCRVLQVDDWAEYFKKMNPSISKIAIFQSSKSPVHLMNKITMLSDEFEISSSWNFENLEISPKAVTKAFALKKLSQQLQIPLSQIAAIGDNVNDMQMLKAAGLGIAMGNAPEIVKKEADEITDTNDKNGVAKAIRNYLLL